MPASVTEAPIGKQELVSRKVELSIMILFANLISIVDYSKPERRERKSGIN